MKNQELELYYNVTVAPVAGQSVRPGSLFPFYSVEEALADLKTAWRPAYGQKKNLE
jgi:hypothetical protein